MRIKRHTYLACLVLVATLLIAACQAQVQPTEAPPATPTAEEQAEESQEPQEAQEETEVETAETGPIPDSELIEPGKLTIATTGNAKPYTLIDDEGELEGYDIDICRAIADELGLEAEFVTLEWAGILPGLSGGRFDMVCTGVGRTEERLASPEFLFSEATVQDGTGMVVRADDDRFQTWEDACGMTMGGVRGAYYSSDVTELLDSSYNCEAELTEYPGETELYLDLKNARVDFATTGYLVGAVRAQDDPDLKLGAEPFNPVTKGIPINKNAPTLLQEVNRLIEEFSETGQLEEWQVKWFGVAAMPEPDNE